MRIAIATDAWSPQVNGVVTTLRETARELAGFGHEVLMITPERRRTIPCPGYPEIRLALFAGTAVARELDAFDADCVHIATEGPIGMSVRRYCLRRDMPFTTAYHTQFPEYLRARAPIPIRWSVRWLRRFHGPAARTLVPSESIRSVLEKRGFGGLVIWERGVATDIFRPDDSFDFGLPRPIWVCAGRVAVEKNIEAFLDLDLEGSKVIIGDGPDRERLARSYPDCRFTGYRFGRELARHLAGADVFVFPSRTDTYGIVMLEAMACGLPVAAYPVTGPIDLVVPGETGHLDADLRAACRRAIGIDRAACRRFAERRSWSRATEQFVANLAPRR